MEFITSCVALVLMCKTEVKFEKAFTVQNDSGNSVQFVFMHKNHNSKPVGYINRHGQYVDFPRAEMEEQPVFPNFGNRNLIEYRNKKWELYVPPVKNTPSRGGVR